MRERGELIRTVIPEWLAEHDQRLASSLGVAVDDLVLEGRDGTGLKTKTPWVRVASRRRSPRATNGFYAVYLFDTRGDAVFLSLNQGTTDFNGGDFVAKPPAVIDASTRWARTQIARWVPHNQLSVVRLNDTPRSLAAGYERGDIASFRYGREELPSADRLLDDLLLMCDALRLVYEAAASEPVPGNVPEVDYAAESAATAAGKQTRARGAGFRLNAREIRAIERHAVAMAAAHYESRGWRVKDVGASSPYDLDVRRDEEHLNVEVKGTTSNGDSVVLTDGEVRHHARGRATSVLVIVRNIRLFRTPDGPQTEGGELHELTSWRIDRAHLRPISYMYAVPPGTYERSA